MDAVLNFIDGLLGIGLEPDGLEAGLVILRAVVVYMLVLLFVRLGKRRFMGGASAFDVILAIMLGAVASRAITGNAPFWTTMAATAALMAMHWIFSWGSFHSSLFGWLVKGKPIAIVKDGVADRDAMRRSHFSSHDLEASLRESGVRETAQVAEACLERSGKLSVVKKDG